MENKVKRVADFLWTSYASRRRKEPPREALRFLAESYTSHGYAPEFRSRRKEFDMARRQKTILCVDDNQSSLNICKIVLTDFGYEVITAGSGREGLEVFAANAIDAVILDYQMPEMNGELVAAEMRRTKPRVPILMLSGWGSVPESALQAVDGFIAKGDPVEFLLLAIQQVLGRGEKRQPVRASTRSRVALKPESLDSKGTPLWSH